MSNLIALGQTVWVYVGVPQQLEDNGATTLVMGRADPVEIRPSPRVTLLNLDDIWQFTIVWH